MRGVVGFLAVVLFVGGVVFAANTATITYTLQLGGHNAAAQGWTGDPSVPPLFDTTGLVEPPAFCQSGSPSEIITWSVRVEVGGMHGPDGAEIPVEGAANLVWDLKLHQGPDTTGPLVPIGHGSPTTTGFFSSVQNGFTIWGGSVLAEQNAAFPWVFDPWGSMPYGRIFDAASDIPAGVGMQQYTYPNTAGFKPGSAAAPGTLMGMGAGYREYSYESWGTIMMGGVGLATGDCYMDIGNLPIAEGQINTFGLPTGWYTLELVPGKGNNALWIDPMLGTCDSGSTGAFAIPVAPENVHGSAISFRTCCIDYWPPIVTSVRTHGAAGTFALPIALPAPFSPNPPASVECRQGGPQQVVIDYLWTMTGTPVVTLTATGGAAPTLGTVTLSGSRLTINMSGAVDKTCITIAVAGITDVGGSTPLQNTFKLTYRYCDVNGDHRVSAADVSAVKAHSMLANVNSTNFWYDVDCSGKTNAADVSAVKSHSILPFTTCAYP